MTSVLVRLRLARQSTAILLRSFAVCLKFTPKTKTKTEKQDKLVERR